MDKLSRRTILAAFLALQGFLSFGAQLNQQYSYTQLTPSDGYPSKPTSIVVENFGYAWIGTQEGVYRVESNNVRHITDRDEFPVKLPGNEIYAFLPDAEQNLWIFTDNGICYRKMSNAPEGLVAYSAVSTNSSVFLGCENEIWRYDYSTSEFTRVAQFESEVPFKISHMFMGVLGRILVFSSAGKDAYFFYPETDRIEKVDPRTYEWANGYHTVFMDSEYRLWVSYFNKGVVRYDHYGNVIQKYNVENGLLSNNIVNCIVERGGEIWVGTEGGGICILNTRENTSTALRQDPSNPRTIPANIIKTMTVDDNHNVWVGRENGGLFIISDTKVEAFRTEAIRPHINSEGILSLYQRSKDKVFWIGTKGSGLLSYDPDTDKFTQYPSTAGLQISDICDGGSNCLILSTPSLGLFIFWTNTGVLQKPVNSIYDSDADLLSGSFSASLENDENGNILVLSEKIYKVTIPSEETQIFPFPQGVESGDFNSVQGSRGKFFYGSGKLFKWDNSLADKVAVLKEIDSSIHCATMGLNGNIWFAAGDHICSYDLESGEVTKFPLQFATTPQSLACDEKGNLWIGTKSLLYCYEPRSGAFTAMENTDGAFDNEYEPNASIVCNDGTVVMAGVNGIVRINPELDHYSVKDPQVVVLEVKVDREMKTDLSGTLEVPSNFKDLYIRFFVKDSDLLRKKHCRLYVTGPGTSYMEETDRMQMSFRGLRTGQYYITASCVTKEGRWTDPAQVFTFRVRPPWYFSWWFIFSVLGFMIIAGLITFTIYRQENNLNQEKEANEERLNFLVNVSHELRTPLTLVMGPLARILSEMPEDDKYHDKLKHVYTQANRMKTLLNTILTTNKIKAGATEAKLAPVLLNDWVTNCINTFKDEATGRNMQIMSRLDPAVGTVKMDDNLCQIVFSNIMMNGLKHNEPGKSIIVKTELRSENSMVRISISDHGTGFGNVDMSQLFVRFYRVKEDQTGFGIGLAYAKTIIDEHNGNIGAYNNIDGVGATFWFEIPYDMHGSAGDFSFAPPVVKASEAKEMISQKDLAGKSLLFVDDDPDLRQYIEDEYTDTFAKIYLAKNGIEALGILRDNEVDIVVSDVMMPEMDGLELCKRIKAEYKRIPVILLTARADAESTKMGYAAKADVYMPKPFKTDKLLKTIEILL